MAVFQLSLLVQAGVPPVGLGVVEVGVGAVVDEPGVGKSEGEADGLADGLW